MSSGKKILCLFTIFLCQTVFAAAPPGQAVYDSQMLATNYNVYTNGTTVINHPANGFTKVLLPTANSFTGVPGCYIACYSRSAAGIPSAGYSIGWGIYVHGQVRVAGAYNGRNCVPTGYLPSTDLSKVGPFNNLCNQYIAFCAGSSACGSSTSTCWAGGDTGGWYGIQP